MPASRAAFFTLRAGKGSVLEELEQEVNGVVTGVARSSGSTTVRSWGVVGFAFPGDSSAAPFVVGDEAERQGADGGSEVHLRDGQDAAGLVLGVGGDEERGAGSADDADGATTAKQGVGATRLGEVPQADHRAAGALGHPRQGHQRGPDVLVAVGVGAGTQDRHEDVHDDQDSALPNDGGLDAGDVERQAGERGSGDPGALGDGGGLDPAADTQLAQDVRDVDAGRLLGDVELGADLAVGAAGGHQGQHLGLA